MDTPYAETKYGKFYIGACGNMMVSDDCDVSVSILTLFSLMWLHGFTVESGIEEIVGAKKLANTLETANEQH